MQRPVRPHPPSGPGRCPCRASPWCSSSKCRPGPIRARIDLILPKVNQNGGVSPKYHQKAYHSPCSQNGSQKSALEIPRIPFSRAFSHKELMGHFDVHSGFIVKMTKCRQDAPTMSREVYARYPHMCTQQAASVHMLLIWLGAVFSTSWF